MLPDLKQRFEAAALPHLDAAYNLARWLLRNDADAQDVMQEAYLRAFRFFHGFRGVDARPWLLTIVRNTCHTWLRENRYTEEHVEFDEERGDVIDPAFNQMEDNPEALLLQKLDQARVNSAIEMLPTIFREMIVLRELEDLSYEEIAQIAAIPVGTVMSRLSRARGLLRKSLSRVD